MVTMLQRGVADSDEFRLEVTYYTNETYETDSIEGVGWRKFSRQANSEYLCFYLFKTQNIFAQSQIGSQMNDLALGGLK